MPLHWPESICISVSHKSVSHSHDGCRYLLMREIFSNLSQSSTFTQG